LEVVFCQLKSGEVGRKLKSGEKEMGKVSKEEERPIVGGGKQVRNPCSGTAKEFWNMDGVYQILR